MNTIKNTRILITGGAGFIGYNLVDRLLEQNNQLVYRDYFSTGKRENLELLFAPYFLKLID